MLNLGINVLFGAIFGILFKYDFNFIYLCLFCILSILLIIKTKKYYIFALLSLILFLLITNYSIYDVDDYIDSNFLIIEKHDGYYILINNNHKYLLYSEEDYNLFTKLNIKGNYILLETNKSINVKSFNDYLYTQGIYYRINASSIDILKNGDFIHEKIVSLLTYGLNDYSLKITNILVYGDKNYDLDFYESISQLGIVHLFVISGFHLNILYKIIKKIFPKFNDKYILLILMPYLYILNFSLPVLRAFLYILFKEIFKKKNASNLSILIFICTLFLLFNYHLLFNLSFKLTFITNFIIIILNNLTINKNILYKILFRGLIIQLSIFPIILGINYEYNIVSILFILLLSFPIEILYIFGLFNSLIKVSDYIYNYVCKVFINFIEKINGYSINLIFGKPNIIFYIIYYVIYLFLIYFLIIRNKKKSTVLSFSLFFIILGKYYEPYIFLEDEIIFLNVNQGDCTLLLGKNNKYSILIDTGGLDYLDTAKTYIIPLLKSKGIKKLDAVIITHEDYDHCGALESLKENYNCLKIYKGYKENIININGFVIKNYNQYWDNNDEENTKSAVLYFENNNIKYLIMGDAPIEIENKIMDDNPHLYCDVIRIGHHGSKTSTSSDFINFLNPKYAVISVGYNNYGHPHQITLKTLENADVEVLRTDKDYNICFKNNKIIKKY